MGQWKIVRDEDVMWNDAMLRRETDMSPMSFDPEQATNIEVRWGMEQ